VWQGDRDLVALWPQRSLGPTADFFQSPQLVLDVFPGVRDEVWGLGVDRSDGVYVASFGNGLAYLAPATQQPRYWSRATTLPQDRLTDVTVDSVGEVWISTYYGGVARYNPSTNGWTYYTAASGLASDEVRRLYVDKYGAARVIYFATANGITIFRP
jgi:streptogramin lyase